MPSVRRERLALLCGFGLGSLGWNVCWPFLPLRVQAVGVADLAEVAQLSGLLAGATNLITAALGPLWSTLGERFGYKRQILRAHFGTGLSMAAFGLARGPLELIGAGGLLGVLGGNYPHYMALAASRAEPAEVGRVVGDLQAAGQIGGTIGPLVGGLVAGELGLTPAFLLSSAISLVAICLVFTAVRADAPVRSEVTTRGGGLRQAFAQPQQRWLMLLAFMGDAGIQGIRPLIPIVVQLRVADPAAVAPTSGLVTTLATGGTVVAALAVGRVGRWVEPRTILLIALPLAALMAALLPLTDGLVPLVALWALLGLVSGASAPTVFAWLGRLVPGERGGFALLASANMIAYGLGPAIMGQVSLYGLDWPFRVAAAMTLGAALVVLFRGPRVSPVSM